MGTVPGASTAGVVGRNRNFEPISGFIVCCQRCNRPRVINTLLLDYAAPQVVTLITGSKRWSWLTAGDDNEMFMTRSFNVTPKTTEQHLIVCSDKSVAYVANNKRLCLTF